jgi:predicted dehydrogenase
MTRRSFVAAASALFGAERIRIAFIGLNHSHAEDKVKICRNSPDWEFAGAWEPNEKVAAPHRQAGVPFVDKAKILADPTIPVVAIESEVKPHARLALEALAAGKHLHLEKPPSDNMADMRKILELARKQKKLVQIGYMWRHHPGMNKVIEAARQGWLGDVYLVRGQMNTLITDRRWEWALFHGGQMYEQGGHLIDPLVRMMGRPTKITHFLRHDGKVQDKLLDNTAAVFEYPSAMGVITSSVLQPGATGHRMFEVQGSNGVALLRPIEGPPRLEIELVNAAGPYKAGKNVVELPPFQRYVGDFIELASCLRTNTHLTTTPQQDLEVQDALLRASDMFV